MKRPILLLFILFFICSSKVNAQQQIIAQLMGAPVDTAGWTFVNSAKLANITQTGNSEVLLCPSLYNATGGVYYRTPLDLTQCKKWTIEFDLRMHDGSGADGMAFCFLDSPFTNLHFGGDLGIPIGAAGLKVCFDTWHNCGGPVPKIYIRYSRLKESDDWECLDTDTLTVSNINGQLNFLNSATYTHARITYEDGRIKVYLNDSLYLSGYHQFDFSGYMGFTAATGGATNNYSIKNVLIYTEPSPDVYKIKGKKYGLCNGGTFAYKALSKWYSGFTWSVTGGAAIVSGQGTDSINVQIPQSFTGGLINVTASSDCGAGNIFSDSLSVKPERPTAISGPAFVAPGQPGIVFSTSDSDGDAIHWEVPAGATIVSGQGTNSVTVNWGSQHGNVKAWVYECNDSSKQTLPVHIRQPTDTMNIISNDTWKATATLYDGWEKSGFDDASWGQATSPSPGDYHICSNSLLTMWGPVKQSTVYLRKQFDVPGTISKIIYRAFGVDDDADVYINDSLVIHNADCIASDLNLKNQLMSHLHEGTNTIAIMAHDCGGCYSMSVDFDIVFGTGTGKSDSITINKNNINTPDKLLVYPNPATNFLTAQFRTDKAAKYSLELTDITGKILYRKEAMSAAGDNIISIDINRYAKGTYIISITDDSGKRTTKIYKQ